MPEPLRLLQLVENVLPTIGKHKIDKLIEDVDAAQNYLLEKPVETPDYVAYLEYIEKAGALVDEMEVVFDYCKDLYDIMEEFDIRTAPEEISNYLGISVTLGNLRNLVDKKTEETPRIIKNFNDQLNKDINALLRELGVIKDECMVYLI